MTVDRRPSTVDPIESLVLGYDVLTAPVLHLQDPGYIYIRRPLARCLEPFGSFLLPNTPPPTPSPGVQLPLSKGGSIALTPSGRHLVANFWSQLPLGMSKFLFPVAKLPQDPCQVAKLPLQVATWEPKWSNIAQHSPNIAPT